MARQQYLFFIQQTIETVQTSLLMKGERHIMKQQKIFITISEQFAPDSRLVLNFAAEELSRYLGLILAQESGEISIFLEPSEKELRYDGYRIVCRDRKIRIQAACARGILHGAYELLRKLGCRFTFPGEARQHLPSQVSILSQIDETYEPWLEYRGICLYHTTKQTWQKTLDAVDWMAKNGYNLLLTSICRPDDSVQEEHAILWEEIGEKLLPELQKRGIEIDMSEHATDYFFPREKLFPEHPEWFSLKEGKRQPIQICYSNPEAVEAYADNLAAFAADKPWIRFLGIWPLDGGDYCDCEGCRDPLAIYKANVRIAEKLAAVRPDLTVEHLAYTPQSFARPTEKAPENMSVLVCSVRDKIASEWALCTKNGGGAFYFDYNTGDHYRWRSNLWLNPYWCREMVNVMAAYGYRGIVSLYLPVECWWQSSINYWYLRRFYYNPAADIVELTKELAEELFSSACKEQMADILLDIYKKVQDPVLWNGMPFKFEWFQERLWNRNQALDSVHLSIMRQELCQLRESLDRISVPKQNLFSHNRKLLEQYLELQRLYYENIDQFHAESDTQAQADPYFAFLHQLEQQEDSPFITEQYARWRIIGRDNIFIPEQGAGYQASAE